MTAIRRQKEEEERDNGLKRLEHQVIDFSANPSQTTLPPPRLALPRFLKFDPERTLTRWEQFAKSRGIQKRSKRSRLVWSDEARDWMPRWGRRSAKNLRQELDVIREVA